MHDVAIVGVAAQDVGNDFTEGLWIETFVNVLNCSVDVLLCSRDTTLHVAVVGHFLCLVCCDGIATYGT